MKRSNLVEYAQANGFNAISKVRSNTNGYLYITFIDMKNPDAVENIYATLGTSEVVVKDDQLDPTKYFIVNTTNEKGEPRIKFSQDDGTEAEAKAEATLIARGYAKLF